LQSLTAKHHDAETSVVSLRDEVNRLTAKGFITFLTFAHLQLVTSGVKRGQNLEAEARATRPRPRPISGSWGQGWL